MTILGGASVVAASGFTGTHTGGVGDVAVEVIGAGEVIAAAGDTAIIHTDFAGFTEGVIGADRWGALTSVCIADFIVGAIIFTTAFTAEVQVQVAVVIEHTLLVIFTRAGHAALTCAAEGTDQNVLADLSLWALFVLSATTEADVVVCLAVEALGAVQVDAATDAA